MAEPKKNKFRPHGHLGADTTKTAAEQKVLMDHFGPYYKFIQKLGAISGIYLVLGALVGYKISWMMALMYGIGAVIYAFLFHVLAISYLGARSNIGLNKCRKGSPGYIWSKLFIPRAIIMHLVMMSLLIWVSPLWFLLSGILLYIADYILTLSLTLPGTSGRDKNKNHTPGKGDGG